MATGLGLHEPLLEKSDRCAIAGGVKRARPAAARLTPITTPLRQDRPGGV